MNIDKLIEDRPIGNLQNCPCNFIIQPESQGKSFCVYRSDCCTQHNSSTARIPIGIEEKPECGKIGVDERIKAQICQMVGEREY